MNALIDAALHYSRTVLTTLVLVLIAGVAAYLTIPKEADPDINIPIIYVFMKHDGISPEDSERLLVRPMEQELRSIEGVKEMRSTAAEGYASVLLEFEAGFNADKAKADVREKVDVAKKDLPEETEDPEVNEVNVGLFPVLVVTLSGNVPERALISLARNLQDDLEGLPGVLSADIAGERDEVLEMLVDPSKLESYNLSQQDLINAVRLNNRLVAAGALDTGKGRFSVKVPGLFRTALDVMELPIKVSGDGVVTLGDVTSPRRTFKDPESYARLNGTPSIALEIRKRLGENIIETIDSVRRAVAEKQARWPPNVTVTFSQDKSKDIRTMLTDLQNNVISAILLVMIVVVAALGLRTAALVGLAIPSSFLIGILYLYIFGFTINMVVLFSLILAVGMLVDGAIVVTEFADRKMTEGLDRREAYAQAAKRMAWPIIASTATTLAAFMPLLFWPGVVGEFMKFLPLTLITTLTGSLLMALIFVPTLGAIFGKPGTANNASLKALTVSEHADVTRLGGFTGVYARTLTRVLRHPLKLVLATVALLAGVQYYYANHGNGVEFFPSVDPDSSLILVHARGNLSLNEKDALVREVENRVLQLNDFDAVYTRSGKPARSQEQSEDVIGVINLSFKNWQSRRPANVVLDDIRRRTADLAGITVEARKPDVGPPTGKDIRIQLSSRSPEALARETARVRKKLESMANIVDVEDSRPIPGIEWRLKVDRPQAGRFGADVVAIGKTVQLVTNGIKVGAYRPDNSDDEIDIRMRFPSSERTIDQLDRLRVQTRDGLVPISNFVTREAKPKVGTIRRVDGKRVLIVQANVLGNGPNGERVLVNDKVQELAAWFQSAALDPRVTVEFKGQDEEQKKASAFLIKAFAVAMFIMAIILVTQFNSFYHAFLILTAVIMSTIGVMIGLIVTGQPFGIVMTGIGVIALAGIVVNNNIVLIDTYAYLKRQGLAPLDAIVRTGAQRLRPVLLTTVTTIFGLLPMMLQTNIDFVSREVTIGAPSTQWWVQLSTAVVFGLTFATVLTLVVTPCMLAIGANFSNWRARRKARRSGLNERSEPAPEPEADQAVPAAE